MYRLLLIKKFYLTHNIEYTPLPSKIVSKKVISCRSSLIEEAVVLAKRYKLDATTSGFNGGDLFNFKPKFTSSERGSHGIEIVYRLNIELQNNQLDQHDRRILNTIILKQSQPPAKTDPRFTPPAQ